VMGLHVLSLREDMGGSTCTPDPGGRLELSDALRVHQSLGQPWAVQGAGHRTEQECEPKSHHFQAELRPSLTSL
jgi:hypothetical protein